MRFLRRGTEPDITEHEKKVEHVIEEWNAASEETQRVLQRVDRLSVALAVRQGRRSGK